jgi:hypothetical protein
VTGDPLAVLGDENVPQALPLQLDPVALQFTAPPSLVVAVSDSVCEIVNPARFGEIETETAGVTVRESVADWFCAGCPASVTLKVRDAALTAAVGVPLMTPLDERLSPAGSVPVVSDQVYAGVPPLAARFVL